MLYYALVFFVISIIAGLFGFQTVSSGAAGIAKIFFFIFITLTALVIISAMFGISLFA